MRLYLVRGQASSFVFIPNHFRGILLELTQIRIKVFLYGVTFNMRLSLLDSDFDLLRDYFGLMF